MTSSESELPTLFANSARWAVSRLKGKRKRVTKGGKKKRRRRKYNLSNLKCNKKTCICSTGCVCEPITQRDVSSQTSQLLPTTTIVNVCVQTEPELTKKIMVDAATEIVQHNKLNPKASTWTRGDDIKQKSAEALTRLTKVIPRGFHWTGMMIAVVLRLLFNMIYVFNWNWTQGVHMTAKLLNLHKNSVFKLANNYINTDVTLPNELVMKKRGRGSDVFIANHGKDYYSALKEVR